MIHTLMKDLIYHFRCGITTRFLSEYLMRIKNIHLDDELRLHIENDNNTSQQYI